MFNIKYCLSYSTIQYNFIDLRRRNSPLVRLRDRDAGIMFLIMFFCSLRDSISLAESIEKSRFQEESATDPTIFDKSSIITRSYKNKRRVSGIDSRMIVHQLCVAYDVWRVNFKMSKPFTLGRLLFVIDELNIVFIEPMACKGSVYIHILSRILSTTLYALLEIMSPMWVETHLYRWHCAWPFFTWVSV